MKSALLSGLVLLALPTVSWAQFDLGKVFSDPIEKALGQGGELLKHTIETAPQAIIPKGGKIPVDKIYDGISNGGIQKIIQPGNGNPVIGIPEIINPAPIVQPNPIKNPVYPNPGFPAPIQEPPSLVPGLPGIGNKLPGLQNPLPGLIEQLPGGISQVIQNPPQLPGIPQLPGLPQQPKNPITNPVMPSVVNSVPPPPVPGSGTAVNQALPGPPAFKNPFRK